ncbi:YheC/YheD family endospore coat-associated protein [Alkaliphilus serpentinus]|uniref:YheC/YheD family protein n=1 Tax=Alkaliphilus serpentinus TaxID=1482731 RepID=A0A833HN99_9FIRM|nr:YheC/YheD family protein [Alkaliphilus serpentinus]KAB3529308.1 YheC/YheD family protein [Alkaliphilus serpentinus]
MELLWLRSLKEDFIAMNPSLYKKFSNPKKITLHFGQLKMELKAVVRKTLAYDTIGLSHKLHSKFLIPKDVPYEIYNDDGDVYIGPLIAYISLSKYKQLLNQKYVKSLPSFLDYNSVKGVIVICAEDSINLKSGTIEGYYLSKGQKKWKEGIFPLPDAIFNHSLMNQNRISSLQKKIGDKVFNSYRLNLNKWETWQLLSTNSKIAPHLPYTEKYTNIAKVKGLLEKYHSLYLKPASRARGIGQMKLDKERRGISLVDFEKNKLFFKDYQDLSKFLDRKISTNYIVQQAVHYKAKNRHVDFRLVLQKNSDRKWGLTGLVARIAKEGSIITNAQGRDQSILGKKALKSIFGLSDEKAKSIISQMTDIVIEAVNMYEKNGYHLGDLAADIALDPNLHIWLLELQLNYGVNARTTEGLTEFFQRVVSTPFKYAKALSGFTSKNTED